MQEIFVPGRLCLFGEHSDWAGGHRRQNSDLEKGYAIVAPTNQGNYARIRTLDKPVLKFISQQLGTLEIELNESQLFKAAEEGGKFSYIAGTAHEIVINHHNHMGQGIEIDNFRTDLPIKKGLSSSASICVLVARAFNILFDYHWTTRREMELAYFGEITTPSRCGRLDQACAYDKPVLMTFDADRLGIEEILPESAINLLIVDLKGEKDTQKILRDLNKGFPFASTDEEFAKHDYLGPINAMIVRRAARAIMHGDPERLGKLMNQAQHRFDFYLGKSCDELTSPLLHEILAMEKLREYVYGGKGVGSQGDGCAQFVCKGIEEREKARQVLEEKEMECFDLDIKPTQLK